MTVAAGVTELIEWGWAGSALEGGESGDRALVAPFPTGVLVAAIDGLGHGPEAAHAAAAAVAILEASADAPVIELIERCHEGLRKTRGVVMTLVSFNGRDSSLSWAGVGNVEGVLLRADDGPRAAREAVLLQGGVVGYQLPHLRASVVRLQRLDTLCLVTDGLRSGFAAGLALGGGPQEIAAATLSRFAKGTDDALVVVVRYLGGTA
jgi:hypothetical protein